jgi:hypothetical protein
MQPYTGYPYDLDGQKMMGIGSTNSYGSMQPMYGNVNPYQASYSGYWKSDIDSMRRSGSGGRIAGRMIRIGASAVGGFAGGILLGLLGGGGVGGIVGTLLAGGEGGGLIEGVLGVFEGL